MSILDRIVARYQRNVAETQIQYRQASAGGMIPAWQANRPTWLPRTIETHDEYAYRRVPLIFRCVQYVANATGTAPLRVYAPNEDEADDGHPLRQLLIQPNPGMGEGRFLSFVAMNMAVTNFTVVEIERSNGGLPIGLWPLRSDWIRPILRSQQAPDWEYRVPGRDPILIPAEDAIPITYADTPDQSPTGIGPLVAALREAQITSSITDFVKAFMDRGALPLYALVPQDDGPAAAQWQKPETRAAFLDAWRQRYMGLANAANEPLPLLGVKDVKRIGLDFNELAYADLNNRIDAGICQAFGIPPILVSAPVGLERSTFSNTGEARRSFYEDTMSYLWGRIDDAFTRHLLPEFEQRPGWDIHFDTSDIPALQDDRNEAVTRGVSLWDSGLASRHIAQIEAGLPVHGPDTFKTMFNVTEVPVVNEERTRRANFMRVDGEVEWLRMLEDPALNAPRIPAPDMALPSGHDPNQPRRRYIKRDGRYYINERAMTDSEREQRARIVESNNASITALADAIAPRLESFFAGQAERVTEQLGLRAIAGNGQHEQRAAEAIDWAAEDDALLRLFGQWWDSVSDTALGNAESLLGTEINWSVVNPYLGDVTGILGQRIVGINAQTAADIESTLTRLMLEGTDVPSMGAAIRDLFEQTYANRHIAVARTESMVGYGEASAMAYRASGVVDRVQIHDNASHTDDYGAADGLSCSRRNGLVVPLDRGTFHIRADHPNGSASMSPVLSTPLGEV